MGLDGPSFNDQCKDRRGAVMALWRQVEGNFAKRTRKAKAYASISQVQYQGERTNFEFSSYVQIHQDGHNEVLELEESVPETKMVQDFLSRIINPRLQVGKDIIIATPQYLQDFEDCQ
jgi:ribosomal protein L32E